MTGRPSYEAEEYMIVTRDKYELPIAVGDSVKELAYITKRSLGSLYSSFSRSDPGYVKVKVGKIKNGKKND